MRRLVAVCGLVLVLAVPAYGQVKQPNACDRKCQVVLAERIKMEQIMNRCGRKP